MAEPEQGARIAALAFCWSGDLEKADAPVKPILEFGQLIMTIAGEMPYAAWNGGNDAPFPYGRRYYLKSVMLREIDDRVIDTIAEFAANPPLPWLNVTIEHYSGAMNRLPADVTAFPHRDAHYQVVIVGAWEDPKEDAIGRQWARDIHAAIEPYAKEGTFLNFIDIDGNDRQERIRAGYSQSWDRLVEVKRLYDPDNVFHRNNTIPPS